MDTKIQTKEGVRAQVLMPEHWCGGKNKEGSFQRGSWVIRGTQTSQAPWTSGQGRNH